VWFDQRVSIIIPCYREARLVGRTLSGIPSWVDRIHVVDDGSDDGTDQVIQAISDERVDFVRHPENLGVGAAIVTGYLRAIEAGAELLVVMGGDNQMDPADLPRLLAPLVNGVADYTKGNRFRHAEIRSMPLLRRIGGKALSFATRCMTGLTISDSQCGYTALRATVAARLPLLTLWPRFGYPNDLLGMLAARGVSVRDVVVRPVYADERSGIRVWHLFIVLFVIFRRFWMDRLLSRLRTPTIAQHAE
jgi:glycosyltransferase involved in cell wall biosynthesis